MQWMAAKMSLTMDDDFVLPSRCMPLLLPCTFYLPNGYIDLIIAALLLLLS